MTAPKWCSALKYVNVDKSRDDIETIVKLSDEEWNKWYESKRNAIDLGRSYFRMLGDIPIVDSVTKTTLAGDSYIKDFMKLLDRAEENLEKLRAYRESKL
ncbi:hypothetical protein KY330_06015 [Candidatus Woesearchaeota archaeon]|nr:hypothetical protein [Candidatus Woesearchaeota archaeon]